MCFKYIKFKMLSRGDRGILNIWGIFNHPNINETVDIFFIQSVSFAALCVDLHYITQFAEQTVSMEEVHKYIVFTIFVKYIVITNHHKANHHDSTFLNYFVNCNSLNSQIG